MSLIEQIDKNRLPQHVAIIMDGNGRWAKAKGKDRSYGHQEGVVSVRKVVEAATTVGLKYLTMYTFSTENWNRPEAEVQALMSLLVAAIHRETPDLMKNNVRLMAIGNLDRLPADAYATLQDCIAQTSANTGVTLILALSYSARWEITEAVKRLAREAVEKKINPDDITEAVVSDYLTTKGIPDPDLLIRTGGEHASATSCFGSCHMPNSSLPMCIGRILEKKSCMELYCITSSVNGASVRQASN